MLHNDVMFCELLLAIIVVWIVAASIVYSAAWILQLVFVEQHRMATLLYLFPYIIVKIHTVLILGANGRK